MKNYKNYGLKTNVYKTGFIDEFRRCGRLENFGIDGVEALYDYLENLANDLGEDIELDVIGLCCEYTRYENLEEYNNDYGLEVESLEDMEITPIMINEEAFIINDY